MHAHKQSNKAPGLKQLIKSIQEQLNKISRLYATHPEQDRFRYALATALATTTFDEKKIAKIKLDLKSIDFDKWKDFHGLGDVLKRYKIQLSPILARSTPLLHVDEIQHLLKPFALLNDYYARNRQDDLDGDMINPLQETLAHLLQLQVFDERHLSLLWKCNLAQIGALSLSIGFFIDKQKEKIASNEINSLFVRKMLEYPNRARGLVDIFELLFLRLDSILPIEATLNLLLTLSESSMQEVINVCNCIAFGNLKNDALSKNDKQRIYQTIFNSSLAYGSMYQFGQSLTHSISQKVVTHTIKTAGLKKAIELHDLLDAAYGRSITTKDQDFIRLNALTEAKEETVMLLENELFELICLVHHVETPLIYEEHCTQSYAQKVKSIREEASKARLYEALFGDDIAAYFRNVLQVYRKPHKIAMLAAFIVNPTLIKTELLWDPKHYAFYDRERSEDFTLSFDDVRILKPYIENDKTYELKKITQALKWLRKNKISTPSHIQNAIDTYEAAFILPEIRTLADHGGAQIANHIFTAMQPLMIELHAQLNERHLREDTLESVGSAPNENKEEQLTLESKDETINDIPIRFVPRVFTLSNKTQIDNQSREVRVILKNNDYVSYTFDRYNFNAGSVESAEPCNYCLHDGKTHAVKYVLTDEINKHYTDPNSQSARQFHLLDDNRLLSSIHYSDHDHRFKIWDLNTQQVIKTINADEDKPFKLLSSNRLAYFHNNDLIIYNLQTNEEIKFNLHLNRDHGYHEILGETPQGILLQSEDALILVNKKSIKSIYKIKTSNSDKFLSHPNEFLLLDDHSIICFTCIRERQVLHGYEESLTFRPLTYIERLKYDTDKKRYCIDNLGVYDFAMPKQCHAVGNHLALIVTQDKDDCHSCYVADFNSEKGVKFYSILTHKDEGYNFHRQSAFKPNNSFVIDFALTQYSFTLGDVNAYIHEIKRIAKASLSTQPSSLWNQKRQQLQEMIEVEPSRTPTHLLR